MRVEAAIDRGSLKLFSHGAYISRMVSWAMCSALYTVSLSVPPIVKMQS